MTFTEFVTKKGTFTLEFGKPVINSPIGWCFMSQMKSIDALFRMWERKFLIFSKLQLVRYSQLSLYFNEFQISTKEKSRGSPLDNVANINNFVEWMVHINMQTCLLAEKATNFSENALNLQAAGRTIKQPDGLRIELDIGDDNKLIRET
ncbi:hypothetical protein G5I_09969 [Acromyrmex echinatior]|uniref:Uncharacterized protein n=1 Tax=Acromyrmex echinatior TaxID=103372 RepID=F4WVM2_ACREC|nr:hypothetical protein G5I_09969 [Acromyrmex echinatior]